MEHQLWKPFSLTHVTYPIHQAIAAPILALLSLTPPFAICAFTTASILYKDVIAAYLLVGTLFSAGITSILKRLIQQPRPPRYDDTEGEEEYGMPSNHSCFAWFVASFVILYVARGGAVWAGRSLPSYSLSTRNNSSTFCTKLKNENQALSSSSFATLAKLWHNLHTSFTIVIALSIAVGCAYSRIYLGYHTPTQVYAGSALGSSLGILWYWLFETELVRGILIWLDMGLCELEQARRGILCLGILTNEQKKG